MIYKADSADIRVDAQQIVGGSEKMVAAGLSPGSAETDPVSWEGLASSCRGRLREAVAADCPAILEVMFSTRMSKESSWWQNTVAVLEAKLAEGGGFVAEVQGDLVGCVMHVAEGDALALRGLAVRPEYEGLGIGTALVQAVEQEACRRGIARMLLAVSAANLEVCDYYLRLGYAVSDEPYAHAVPGRPAPRVFTKTLSPVFQPNSFGEDPSC